MSTIDTSAADDGSIDAMIHDWNEMALGWYSAVTGKGLVRTQNEVAGVAPGTTLAQANAPVTAQVFGAQPLAGLALVALVVVLGVLLLK